MSFTNLEKQVYNAVIDICVEYSEANVEDIALETCLDKNIVKGVVGSLVKKEMLYVGQERRDFKVFQTINPINSNGYPIGFMCDTHDDEEIESLKIK